MVWEQLKGSLASTQAQPWTSARGPWSITRWLTVREVWSPGHRVDIWITWGAVSLHLPPPPAPAPPSQLNMSLAAMGTCCPGKKHCPAVRGWQGVSWPSLVLRWGKELRTWEIEKYLLFWRYFRSALLEMIFYKWLTKDFLQSYSVADKLLCLYL